LRAAGPGSRRGLPGLRRSASHCRRPDRKGSCRSRPSGRFGRVDVGGASFSEIVGVNCKAAVIGVHNKQRRAAKARAKTRQRRRQQCGRAYGGESANASASTDTGIGFGDDRRRGKSYDAGGARATELVAAAIVEAASAYASGDGGAPASCAEDLARKFDGEPAMLDAAARPVLARGVAAAWRGGWLPEDLWQLSRRRLSDVATAALVDAIADEHRGYSAARLHPRWSDQLVAVGVDVWWDPSQSHVMQSADRHACGLGGAMCATIEALSLLMTLPTLPRVLPLPGTAVAGGTHRRSADPKILARVRGLLAKAESTESPEEAEALSSKAQELMSRYALERALVDADAGDAQPVTARRLWLDAPYVGAKSLLVDAVASANRCRTVLAEKLGFVTVLGDDVDLDAVETLMTSLLVQATRAMVSAGRQTTRYGVSRTRSYRQSFLVAYATRIRERLDAANAGAVAETDRATATEGAVSGAAESVGESRLLPVLAARERAVDDLCDELFPKLVTRRTSVSNAAGYHAGRAAADLAVLDAGSPLEARRSA
jgi:hypothetical protein